MVIAIDTNLAVDFLNGKTSVCQKIFMYDKIYLPFIVCGELLYGTKNSAKKEENLKKLNDFFSSCIILNSNKLVADIYSDIRKDLKDAGSPIPENDIWIAAICKSNDIPIATRDRHFTKIKNIVVEIWDF